MGGWGSGCGGDSSAGDCGMCGGGKGSDDIITSAEIMIKEKRVKRKKS